MAPHQAKTDTPKANASPTYDTPYWPDFRVSLRPVSGYKVAKPVPQPKPEKTINVDQLSASQALALRLLKLDTTVSVTARFIKQRYREEVLRLHPDHYPIDLPAKERKQRLEAFYQIQDAYRELHSIIND